MSSLFTSATKHVRPINLAKIASRVLGSLNRQVGLETRTVMELAGWGREHASPPPNSAHNSETVTLEPLIDATLADNNLTLNAFAQRPHSCLIANARFVLFSAGQDDKISDIETYLRSSNRDPESDLMRGIPPEISFLLYVTKHQKHHPLAEFRDPKHNVVLYRAEASNHDLMAYLGFQELTRHEVHPLRLQETLQSTGTPLVAHIDWGGRYADHVISIVGIGNAPEYAIHYVDLDDGLDAQNNPNARLRCMDYSEFSHRRMLTSVPSHSTWAGLSFSGIHRGSIWTYFRA